MGEDEVGGASAVVHHHETDIELIGAERVPQSGPLDGPLNNQKDEDEANYVEVTMDIQGDSIAVHTVKTVAGDDTGEDEKLGLIDKTKRLEKINSFGASVKQNASIHMKQLKRLTSFSKPAKHYDRNKTAATHALTGLQFISKTDGGAGWAEVEKEFDRLTATTDGYLPRALFAQCIGITYLYASPSCFK